MVKSWKNVKGHWCSQGSSKQFDSVLEEWPANPTLLGRSREHVATLLPGAYEEPPRKSLFAGGCLERQGDLIPSRGRKECYSLLLAKVFTRNMAKGTGQPFCSRKVRFQLWSVWWPIRSPVPFEAPRSTCLHRRRPTLQRSCPRIRSMRRSSMLPGLSDPFDCPQPTRSRWALGHHPPGPVCASSSLVVAGVKTTADGCGTQLAGDVGDRR